MKETKETGAEDEYLGAIGAFHLTEPSVRSVDCDPHDTSCPSRFIKESLVTIPLVDR